METNMNSPVASLTRSPVQPVGIDELKSFVEYEVELLDLQSFDTWCNLFAEDGVYWVPANRGQDSWTSHVSLFYDDKHTLKTRVQRLNHSAMHCQEPKSQCVRVVSNIRLEEIGDDGRTYLMQSKFIMLEDRPAKPQRIFAGKYLHKLRWTGERLEIVQKRVDLTNCDQSFPSLSQPF
jgi:3-phenylpropionate/cinnamic acid dioxygenase small subunit